MRRPVSLLMVAALILTACGGWSNSGLNPGNWFGGSRSVAVPSADGGVNPLLPPQRERILSRPEAEDRSVPIAVVSEMRVDRAINGAIVSASGLATRQGAFAPELRPLDPELRPDENGVLTFAFRVVYPEDSTPVGNDRTRTVDAAISFSTEDLRGVQRIRVTGQQNAQESRRN